jgi:hypothetical protein
VTNFETAMVSFLPTAVVSDIEVYSVLIDLRASAGDRIFIEISASDSTSVLFSCYLFFGTSSSAFGFASLNDTLQQIEPEKEITGASGSMVVDVVHLDAIGLVNRPVMKLSSIFSGQAIERSAVKHKSAFQLTGRLAFVDFILEDVSATAEVLEFWLYYDKNNYVRACISTSKSNPSLGLVDSSTSILETTLLIQSKNSVSPTSTHGNGLCQ